MESEKDKVTNFSRLQYLLLTTSASMLRQKFQDRWELLQKSEWENTPENGREFFHGFGSQIYARSGSIQKKVLNSGDIRQWDLVLLIDALEALDRKSKLTWEPLKKIRNQMAHQPNAEISNEDFESFVETISDILISNGVSQEEVEEYKKIGKEEQRPRAESHLNEVNIAEANKLKEVGNELYKNRKWEEAIAKYSEAILLPGISSNDLAVLYSNRSIAYLKLGDFQSAKEDAHGAVTLRPSWFRAYHRLGSAYKALKKFERALKNFQIAHELEPTNTQVKEDVAQCRLIICKRREDEHLDPMHFVQSFDDVAKQMNTDYGTSLSGDVVKKLLSEIGGSNGICDEGDNYRFGREVKQDYAAAAKLYTKAARLGSARGLYSLAHLTVEGQGVVRNVGSAISMLEQAASQEPTVMSETLGVKFPNVGVAESEHALGLSYEEGAHLPIDIKRAMYWYERAIKHGSGDAANNVGLLHSKGEKIPHNPDKAIQYYKLSAFMKVVRAMESLAHLYLQLEDLINSQKWYTYALAKGSVSLKIEFVDKFERKLGKDLNKPLDIPGFEAQLTKEVRNGPLKALIFEDSPQFVMDKMLIELGLKTNSTGNATSRELHGLTDPYRVLIINRHRKDIQSMNAGTHPLMVPPPLKQKAVVDLIGLKPIYLQDMKPTDDHIYAGYVIKLTSIEDAVLGTPSVGVIAEDEKGDVQRVFVYNFKQDKETQNLLGFGCKLSIINPYFRLTADGLPAIRVDDPTNLLFLHQNLMDKSMCRFCGKKNSTLNCRRCMRVVYCSKKCQNQDQTLLNHDLMCKKRFYLS